MKNKTKTPILKPYNRFNRCPDCSEEKDVVLIEVQGLYDGALYIRCKHCNTNWHRFPKGHYLNDRAQKWADGELNA